MGHSYVRNHVHCVFSTKERRRLIRPDLQAQLCKFLASVAESRDEESQRTISTFDLDRARESSVDSRKGLWLLLASLRDLGRVTVQFAEHTNSARLTANPNQPDVTSYFSVFFRR